MQGPKWPLFWGVTGCMLGRAPRTKKTLPNFCENMDPDKWDTTVWYRVTRNPQEFCGLKGYQRDPRIWGVTVTPHSRFEPNGESEPSPGARLYIETLIDRFFLRAELMPVVIQTISVIKKSFSYIKELPLEWYPSTSIYIY